MPEAALPGFAGWQTDVADRADADIPHVPPAILDLTSNEITALMLLASDAFMQANYAQAIELWQKVMDLNSPRINRTQLVESINMAKLLQRRSD